MPAPISESDDVGRVQRFVDRWAATCMAVLVIYEATVATLGTTNVLAYRLTIWLACSPAFILLGGAVVGLIGSQVVREISDARARRANA